MYILLPKFIKRHWFPLRVTRFPGLMLTIVVIACIKNYNSKSSTFKNRNPYF